MYKNDCDSQTLIKKNASNCVMENSRKHPRKITAGKKGKNGLK